MIRRYWEAFRIVASVWTPPRWLVWAGWFLLVLAGWFLLFLGLGVGADRC